MKVKGWIPSTKHNTRPIHTPRNMITMSHQVIAVTGPDSGGHQSQQSIYTTSTDETNGKINIHVSVVFVKSLSDLKKQRAQNRCTTTTNGNGNSKQSAQCESNGNGLVELPTIGGPSNNDDFRRFTGNTSEIVGDTRGDKSCCKIMWEGETFFNAAVVIVFSIRLRASWDCTIWLDAIVFR